jgi:hypothetical protein
MKGLEPRLDVWHLKGVTLAEFMNREIRRADKVLVLCSPDYRKKVHEMEEGRQITGVGWEAMLVGSAMFGGSLPRARVVTALAKGSWAESAPSFLEGTLYVDLSDRTRLDRRVGELVHRLIDKETQAEPVPSIEVLEGQATWKLPFALVALVFAVATFLVGRVIMPPLHNFKARALVTRHAVVADAAGRKQRDGFLPSILDLYRTADDLETAAGHYLLDHAPATEVVFKEQLLDFQTRLGPYNEARSALAMSHDDYEVLITDSTRNNEALRDAARSLLDNDVAEFKVFEPSDLDPRIAFVERHKALLTTWQENRTQLKAQVSRLRAGIDHFEEQLFVSGGRRAPTCR